MSFYCPYCNAENSAGYEWRGMTIFCAACSRSILLEYRHGQTIPVHAYEITFQDFCRLVNERASSRLAHPTIAALLDCTVEQRGDRFVFRQADGALIPLEVAHLRIQSDPVKQRRIYNLSMDLWR